MALNKSKGNMFNWITHTWNPIAGHCSHVCSYCSTNKLKARYDVLKDKYSGPMRLVEKELISLGKDKIIFVAAQNDLFAKEVNSGIIKIILDHCNKFDNKYLFQTKNPERILDFIDHPIFNLHKAVIATTIESNIFYKKIMGNTPTPFNRALAIAKINNRMSNKIPIYITIEPIMKFDENLLDLIEHCNPSQVNIGADSGNNGLPEPNRDNINWLIDNLSKFTKVKTKDNLKRLL